jgi:PhoPQ-activated pathogenicity-related protein
MQFTIRALFAVALALLFTARPAVADLRGYIDKPDKSYGFTIESTQMVGDTKVIIAKMTSQTWRDIAWTHWVTLVIPAKITHPDKAVLHILGGSKDSPAPSIKSQTGKLIALLAEQTGSVMVALQQVPNQPLFGDRYEDALIAMTFAKFMETKDDEWPLLLPMVKSAVRAMDAAQAIAKSELKQEIKEFVVTGASKRGWTTWLTGAMDRRVVAIAPMVIDVLNFGPQMAHQEKSYGRLSEKVKDYDELDLPRQIQTDQGKKLTSLVDPYSYLDKLAMPKLIFLGTNDPYWTVDASSFYFPQLKGGKSLYYEPNAGHGLGPGIVPTAIAFFNASMEGRPMPELTWTKNAGSLTVNWKEKGAKATLWKAVSSNRDFRKATWTGTPLTGEGSVKVEGEAPAAGWTAYYVDVRFPVEKGLPFSLCTEMTVLPDKYPVHEEPKK